MGSFLSHAEREVVWQALSYAFVDNEIDYDLIARKVIGYELKGVEDIFFKEVAPVCYPNVISVIPLVWTFFSDEWLEEEITSLLEKSNRNAYQRMRYKIYVFYLRWACKDIWTSITDSIHAMKGLA